ncbi:MAG: carboxypeptidase regulatory-like domain-containing protein, partial [Opitutaceae bacterium]|nr:carboxypeptidase regulatory-like domain-containing protein [Opitutaceae bacterium]
MNLPPRPYFSAAASLALIFALPRGLAADATTAPAAAQFTGAISGRVQNVATGQYLNNARVTVQGTDRVVFTDQSGSYRLTGLPGGP